MKILGRGSSSSSSSRLPSIPHTETPSWQKPITNFFHNKNDSFKNEDNQTYMLVKTPPDNVDDKNLKNEPKGIQKKTVS